METEFSAPTLIVGVGASAGGLEAIEQMFKSMPTDTGMAFVIVQHLAPNFKSLMDELLSRWTDIPVKRVEEGMKVEPNSIYLIPRKKEMIISQGRLLLTDKDPEEALTLPIDHFFRSLAQEIGSRAVAIVLSGTGSDGSRGIVDVHGTGGLVIAQREDTAKFDGMPLSAKQTGACDLFLAPEEIPRALVQYEKNPNPETVAQLFENISVDERGLKKVFTALRDKYEIDFSLYKLNTIIRRTERRMVVNRILHIDDYADFLASDPKELKLLYHDLLIGVTRFLRDKSAFDELANSAIQEIVEKTADNGEVRIWVAGCSTGEEAYSIAILFKECLEATGKRLTIKIFATDLDRQALDKAQGGVYPVDSLVDMDSKWIEKYFTLGSDGYKINQDLRAMIVFAPHNILKDAPFTKLDLITCRNLLIYFQAAAQKKVLSLFHFGLKTKGFLMMGSSESPGELSDEFAIVSSKGKLFRKQRDVRLPDDVRIQLTPALRSLRASGLPGMRSEEPKNGVSLMATYDAILDQFMPSSVLVDEEGTILHTFAGAGRFLKNNDGRFTTNILDRIVNDLRIAISTALQKAAGDNRTVTYSNVRVGFDDQPEIHCELKVMPILDSIQRNQSYLIQMIEIEGRKDIPEVPEALNFDQIPAEQMGILQAELQYTKESLQATIEELETSNEELQATNEELVASNEELQSTNEELHSVNEELYTVNSEFQNKIRELSELTLDMDNLLQSTEVHTVFLDQELRIRKFTPKIAEKFSFLPQDIGRKFGSFTHDLNCDNIAERLEKVIATGEVSEDEVQDSDGCWYLMRILPYHKEPSANDQSSDSQSLDEPTDSQSGSRLPPGALLTLVDITKLRNVATELEAAIRHRDEFLAMLSHELRNPLGAVVNALNVLKSGKEDRHESAIDVVRRQTKQMSTLLDDLLDVTRVSQGKIQLAKVDVDLRDIVAPAIESVQPMLDARQQTLNRSLSKEAMFVQGNHARLVQVLINLVSNASKYSPSGETIELELKRRGNVGIIRVADNGVGIRPDLLGKVFEMFAQSQRNLDRSDGGLGVGLTLAKSLIELHSGTIIANSDGEGKGSEFIVELPLTSTVHRPASKVTKPHFNHRGRSVVLVEDNVDAAEMLEFLLEDTGFQVQTAYDGKAGLELITNSVPDLAIVDIGIPELTGYEVAKAVKTMPELKGVYLVALTGYGQTTDRTAALEAGFDEHFVKPFDPEKLNKVLAKHLV